MYLRGKPLREVTEVDLLEMKAEGTAESVTLEFKQEMYSSARESRLEMLKDISAMANAFGGVILLGVSEKDHCFCEIVSVENALEHQSAINKSCRANIEENIEGLEVVPINLQDGRHVLAIGIPEGSSKPHVVNYDKHWRCYRRVGTDNHPIGIREMQELILMQDYSRDKKERFLAKRSVLLADKLGNEPNIVLVAVPRHLEGNDLYLTRVQRDALFRREESTLGWLFGQSNPEFTVNGSRAVYNRCYQSTGDQPWPFASAEVFENGYIEIIGFHAAHIKMHGQSDGAWHPLDIIRLLINLSILIRRVQTSYDVSYTRGSIGLTVANPSGFAMQERTRSQNWGTHRYTESECSILHVIEDINMPHDMFIFPVIDRVYRSLGLQFNTYFKDGVLGQEYWEHLQ